VPVARTAAPRRAAEAPQGEAEPEPELTMEEKLRALQTRFRQVDKG